MKKYMVGLMLSIVTTLALAIVPPEQIEKELASGNYTQARAHVEEVLQQKPENARAHLMKAFLLAHVDKDSAAASNELSLVKEYDKKGNVVSSPLFKKVENELYSVPAQQQKEFVAPVKEESDAFWWILSIGAIVAVGASLYFFVFKKNSPQYYYTPSTRNTESDYNLNQRPKFMSTPTQTAHSQDIKQNWSNTYTPQPTTYQQQPTSNSGMGFVGTAAAVGAGVVAGELVHDYIAEKRKEERKKETTSSDDSFSTYNPIYSRSDGSYSSSSSRSSSWDSDSSSSSSYSSSSYSSDSSSYSSSDSSSSSWD